LFQKSFSTKDGVQLDSSTCLLVLDLTPLCGDFTRAFIDFEKESNVPMRYYGVSEAKELDWHQGIISQIVTDGYLDGSLKPPPGVQIPDKDPPKEHMEVEPEVPSFKRLSFNKVTLYFLYYLIFLWGMGFVNQTEDFYFLVLLNVISWLNVDHPKGEPIGGQHHQHPRDPHRNLDQRPKTWPRIPGTM